MSDGLTPNQRRALCTLVEIWPEHDVVLIGAGALGLHLPQPGRITHDLDLTVAARHRVLVERFLDCFADTGTHDFERLASAGNTGGRERRATAEQRLALLRRGLRLPAMKLDI